MITIMSNLKVHFEKIWILRNELETASEVEHACERNLLEQNFKREMYSRYLSMKDDLIHAERNYGMLADKIGRAIEQTQSIRVKMFYEIFSLWKEIKQIVFLERYSLEKLLHTEFQTFIRNKERQLNLIRKQEKSELDLLNERLPTGFIDFFELKKKEWELIRCKNLICNELICMENVISKMCDTGRVGCYLGVFPENDYFGAKCIVRIIDDVIAGVRGCTRSDKKCDLDALSAKWKEAIGSFGIEVKCRMINY